MSKKIMFNDKYGLTQAVLEGRKTMTRRICKYVRPDETYDIVFPVFGPNDFDNNGNNISPLNYAFGWMDNKANFIGWNIPRYKVDEVIAIAQPYRDIVNESAKLRDILLDETGKPRDEFRSGWNNKMFVQAGLMLHHIRITDIKIERLNKITPDECLKEGIVKRFDCGGTPYYKLKPNDDGIVIYRTPQKAFSYLIDKVSGKGVWESNPFVFVYEFKLVD